MTIRNFDELILFVESNKLTNLQLAEIIKTTLEVYTVYDESTDIITELKEYWSKFGSLPAGARPLFLFQAKREFTINDIYKVPELKKYIDEIEEYY
jgi:hypothetical protein